MTASLECSPTITGDEALKIIDSHRWEIDDHFRVDELGDEFPRFAQRLGAQGLYLARAGDNEARTFKVRGALVAAERLAQQGVTAVRVPSAGNHLRGAVVAARVNDIDINGIVPKTAPPSKREGAQELWPSARFQLHVVGDTFNEALEWTMAHPELGELLPPFDDPNIIAGQGTVVDDILASYPDTTDLVAPVGGAGLVSGILQRLDELGREEVRVHAVEAEGSNSLSLSLQNNQLTTVEAPNPRYGGSAVKRIGEHTFRLCQLYQDRLNVFTIPDTQVEAVIDEYDQDRRDLLRESTPNYEPTTLVAIAGLEEVLRQGAGGTVVAVGTGHNDSLYPAPRHARRLLFPTFRA